MEWTLFAVNPSVAPLIHPSGSYAVWNVGVRRSSPGTMTPSPIARSRGSVPGVITVAPGNTHRLQVTRIGKRDSLPTSITALTRRADEKEAHSSYGDGRKAGPGLNPASTAKPLGDLAEHLFVCASKANRWFNPFAPRHSPKKRLIGAL